MILSIEYKLVNFREGSFTDSLCEIGEKEREELKSAWSEGDPSKYLGITYVPLGFPRFHVKFLK